mgnify:CR=1 FL=1
MLRCNCNDTCFYYKKISVVEIDGKKYTQVHNINKCNRLLSENSKKKPCDFNSKILIEEKLLEENKIKNSNVAYDKKIYKTLTHTDIHNKINDMFKYYYIKSYNYFGNLNYYLKLIGYHAHDPKIESLSELKIRLSKKSSNITNIYINKESYLSHTIGEYYYDYENEKQIFNRIKIGNNPLQWIKNKNLQDILKINVIINKKLTKYKKYIKSTKSYNKLILIENLMKDEEDKIEEKQNENQQEEDDNQKENDYKDIENLDDNEFDVERFSDDDNDFDKDNYEDFSD